MTTVLVHGVPETAAVWDLLVGELVKLGHEEPIRLSPPGFGSPVPEGWGATLHDYDHWLVSELEKIGHPVDIVGHDWGGGHLINVAMTRPELLHTWAADCVGVYHPDYEWPGLSKQWQTPGEGERLNANILAGGAGPFAEILAGGGMEARTAEKIARSFDEEMAECILALYRSAAQPAMAELGRNLRAAAVRPGLAIHPAEDHDVGSDEQRTLAAEKAGARSEFLPGLGHWWMTQDPERSARMLKEFWATHGSH
jgi:pimeloyl-ACP methyl ester carboxylesterase